MTAKQFSAALDALGIGRNTVIRYAHGHTPVAESVARLIDMLTRYGIPKEYAQ